MKQRLCLKTILLFFITIGLYASDAQKLDLSKQNNMYAPSFLQLQIFSPYLPHSSALSGAQGFTVSYLYPGFYNGVSGEVHFNYTSLKGDNYYLGLALPNLSFGINKKLFNLKDNAMYLNFRYGLFAGNVKNSPVLLDNTNLLFGLSNRVKGVLNNTDLEFSLGSFFHAGQSSSNLTAFIPKTRGLTFNIHFTYLFNSSLIIGYGLGLGIVQYRYDETELKNVPNNPEI